MKLTPGEQQLWNVITGRYDSVIIPGCIHDFLLLNTSLFHAGGGTCRKRYKDRHRFE